MQIILIGLALLSLNAGSKADTALKNLIGTHPDRRIYYQPTSDNKFSCLDGSRVIPTEAVNDDYCDCYDGSDEPGTSACPKGRFYCENAGYMSRIIPSAWVNDNQCDCCDASDEYNSTVRCDNNCELLGEIHRREQEKNRQIADQGSTIRSQYKEQAKLRREQSSQLIDQYRREVTEKENAIKRLEEEINSDFGPSHVFLPLKGKCFEFHDREYVYKLCPFERATQDSTSGIQTDLGRWAGWAGPTDNLYSVQKYEGGAQCWNGPTRSALINIACGVEDRIISVSEPAKCEYFYEFITPAACPDLDPPEPSTQSLEDLQTQIPITDSSLEVEEETLESDPNFFNEENHEVPDEDGLASNLEKHEEL